MYSAPRKDAHDLQMILRHDLAAGNEPRLWDEFVGWTHQDDFDYELAGPRMLGQDTRLQNRGLFGNACKALRVDVQAAAMHRDCLGLAQLFMELAQGPPCHRRGEHREPRANSSGPRVTPGGHNKPLPSGINSLRPSGQPFDKWLK